MWMGTPNLLCWPWAPGHGLWNVTIVPKFRFNLWVLTFTSDYQSRICRYSVCQEAIEEESTFKGNCSQHVLRIILSNKDIVPGKSCWCWLFQAFSMLWAVPTKCYLPLMYLVAAETHISKLGKKNWIDRFPCSKNMTQYFFFKIEVNL